MLKKVILDFDDTLCLTEEICFNLENDSLKALDREPMERDVHIKTWGMPLFKAIEIRSPGISVTRFKAVYKKVLQKYIAQGLFDYIPKENLNTIKVIKELGISVDILTSRTELEIKHLLSASHKLSKLIDNFYYKENMEYHKPDPRAFDVVFRQSNVKAEECIYVGDSLTDADASNKAGVTFIASLESQLRTKADFSPYKVAHYIKEFPELLNYIKTK